ncbi:MAG: M42 family peptidase [Oscillospiraceae bacterium]|nr:M42 family peptidase [Oscillospiraceae bacterium]
MNREKLGSLIKEISDLRGVSGDEAYAAGECAAVLKNYTDNVEIKGGNVFAHFGKRCEGKPHVLIDAHIDRVGMIVTHSEKGFAKADCIGGLDRRIFPAQRVTVHGEKGDIPGVICTLPPHLAKDSEVMGKASIYIDLMGGEAKPGDYISFDTHCEELLGGRICGGGLDDRCGAAAVIAAADIIREKCGGDYDSLPCSFTILLSEQEEVGERGACVAAFDVDPDIAIAVDVSFGVSQGENPKKCGEMGKGCMIGISPSLDRGISMKFIEIAEEKNMPFQREIMSGLTGTNGDRFAVNRGGARTVTLSIPLRYMHTPAEIIDVSDCENTAELIAEFILRGEF